MKHLLLLILLTSAVMANADPQINDTAKMASADPQIAMVNAKPQSQVINNNIADKDSTAHTVQLGDVQVTAFRNIQRLSKGGIVTDVKNTFLGNLGTCMDVISQLPGVRTDDGYIEVTGRGIPQIYLNGRKLIDQSELDRLSSKDIRTVEVVFNPGAKYGAETKSVILIKTIRKQGEGLSGSTSITGRQARYLSQSDNLFLNYRSRGVDIFGTFNYDFARRYQKQHNYTSILTNTDNYLIDSDLKIYPHSNTYLANFGINWQINSNHYIGAKYEYTAIPNSKSQWLAHESVTNKATEHPRNITGHTRIAAEHPRNVVADYEITARQIGKEAPHQSISSTYIIKEQSVHSI